MGDGGWGAIAPKSIARKIKIEDSRVDRSIEAAAKAKYSIS
jgi:hypothetical protein